MTAATLPLGDAGSLLPQARRTRILRLALAAALAAAALTVVFLARGPRLSAGAFVPAGSNTIVVLDVSQSVEANKLQLAYNTLSFLGHSKAHVGLVVTSGYAYEALPPGSSADALLPIADLFRSRGFRMEFGRPTIVLPPNPWRAAFSAGTELSSGLQLARTIVESEHLRRPSVVLISDLFDDTNDLPRVKAEGQAYQRAGIPLRIVGLDPTFGDLQFFLKAAGKQGSLLAPTAPKEAARELRTAFPTVLVVIAALVALLLAIDELLFAPLRWGASKLRREVPA